MTFSNYPVLAGEVGTRFPFQSWASENRFQYPEAATEFLKRCESAAEAFFAAEFAKQNDVAFLDNTAYAPNGVQLSLQVSAGTSRIDCVVRDDRTELAIEIDGMQFHHRTREQIEKDYLRERRLVLRGYTVIRFMAKETLTDPAECWRQVYAILHKRGRK